MIRINLLPIRQMKKLARLRKEALAAVGLLLFTIIGIGFFHLVLKQKIASLKSEIALLETKKKNFEPIIKEIADLKKIKQDLDNKLTAIKKLKKGSQVTVRVMNELSNLVPQNRIWIESLAQTGTTVTMNGTALDNATVAQFMRDLGSSSLFTEPELSGSSMKEIAGKKLKAFNLTIGIEGASKEEAGKTDKDKKN